MKPTNLFVWDGLLKLDDYGMSGERKDWWYMAPEVLEGDMNLKSDVWSLGISVIEMAEGRHPYSEYDEEELKNAVVNGDSPSLSPSEWSSDLVDFVDACLVKDENERASVRALMEVSVSVAV